jgi:hypothetical protein
MDLPLAVTDHRMPKTDERIVRKATRPSASPVLASIGWDRGCGAWAMLDRGAGDVEAWLDALAVGLNIVANL